MKLRELIAEAGLEVRPPGEDPEVTGLAYRSDAVEPGSLFLCVPGFTADGHDFAADAVERGAVAVVCERPLGLGVPELMVEDVRAAAAPLASAFHGHPTRQMTVVGVTGTNGKTTTAFLVRDVLEAAGRQTGLLGTVQSLVGGRTEPVERTTPEAVDLQATFRRMADSGDAAGVMEVSSHALELRRADAIDFDCAVFTNLTQDHLDFHGTLEEYFAAKRLLFAPRAGEPPGVAAINVDDPWGRRLAQELIDLGVTRTVSFGFHDQADHRAERVRFGVDGCSFVWADGEQRTEIRVPLTGLFNVYNALAAIAACASLGIDAGTIARGLAGAGQVPGRFEAIDEGQQFTVLVDYAHTPDSLANVLEAARELLQQSEHDDGRVICVFGAGGDRDSDKRPKMGAAARRLADHVIVTSDNPRSEDPDAIIAAIVAGAEELPEAERSSSLAVEPDRRAAIAAALSQAGPHDIVLIAGKGHEQGQEFESGRKVPFDDREVARDELRRSRGRSDARPAA
jgi:UDP-N-acetylmuramoyl-L-alanyl-D-glutamate--2,6-diaminopimelate ligase